MTEFWIIEDYIFTGANSTTTGSDPLLTGNWMVDHTSFIAIGNPIADSITGGFHENSYFYTYWRPIDISLTVTDGTYASPEVNFPITMHGFTGVSDIANLSDSIIRFKKTTPIGHPSIGLQTTYTDYLHYEVSLPVVEYNDLVGRPTLTFADSQLSWDSQLPTLVTDSVIIDRFSLPDPVVYVKGGANIYRISNDNHREIYRAKTYVTGHTYNQFDVIYRNDTSVYVVLEDGSGDYDESGNLLDSDADDSSHYLMNTPVDWEGFNMSNTDGCHDPTVTVFGLPKMCKKLGIVTDSHQKINMQTVLKDGSKIILGTG
jgi:hypothetical protein